jgi:hypothetical protein
LRSTRLPRDVVREVVKEVEENPGEAAAIVGKHLLSMPRQLGDNAVEASGKYTYIIRLEASAAEFTARNPGPDTLDGQDTAPRPPHRKTSLATGVKHTTL